MCDIGVPKRIIQVEPLELPAPLPNSPTVEPEQEPVYAPSPVEPVYAPVR